MKAHLKEDAINLLQKLISTPSFSSQEQYTASHIEEWLKAQGVITKRHSNNVYASSKYFDKSRPTLLLNSHHDTVKPNKAYTKDPFLPEIADGKLFGLGSNDAGGCLVSLMAAFTYFYQKKDLNHNLVLVASAEEESSGSNGLNSMLPIIGSIDIAIVGEPTLLELAVAEKGLVVFEATVSGTPGHAAHPNSNNAIYNAIDVIKWFRDFKFERISESLGEVKTTITQINAGSQHNVIPAKVDLVIDVRVNDCYTNSEIAEIFKSKAPCEINPRSLRLNSSSISKDHPLVQAGISLGKRHYGSPTLSDQSVLKVPSVKVGPGDSKRSHSADEYIFIKEIEEGIEFYIMLLEKFLL